MTDEEQLASLLRSAVPPVAEAGPTRDIWPMVASRHARRRDRSWVDAALGAGVAATLLMRPEWLVAVAYYF